MMQAAQWIAGNQSIPLNAATQPATLVSGSMAVFAIDQETDERLHLFSLEPGEPLLALDCPRDAAWQIAAYPLEMCSVQPADGLRDWEQVFARESWLSKLAEALARFRPVELAQNAGSPGPLSLKPKQRITVPQGLTFVQLEDGDGVLSGAPVTAGQTVVLAPGLWLEAVNEAEWCVLENSSSALLATTTAILVPALFDALDHVKQTRDSADRERFFARQQLNANASEAALKTLAGVASQTRDAAPARATGDPLFDAFQAAAAVIGVTAHLPRASGRLSDAVREIAQASGVRTRPVLLAGEWWQRDSGPLIAQRTGGGPVALLPVRGGYRIFDGVTGVTERVNSQTAADLTAFARMLYRPLPEDLSTRSLLRHALSGNRRDIRTAVLAGIAASVLGMAAPQGIAILIGQAIPDADTTMIWQVAAGLVAAAFGSALFLLAQAVALLRVQTAGFMTLQAGVWDYLLKLGPAFFRGATAGEVRARADAITRIHQVLTADALRSLFAGATSFLSLLLILWYSPVLALIALASGLVIVGQTWWSSRTLFQVQQQWQELEEALSGLVLQSINAVSKLRVAGAVNRAFGHWSNAYSRKQKLELQRHVLRDRMRLVNMMVPLVALALAFAYLLGHPLALGAFLACNAAMTVFLTALAGASDSFAGILLVGNLWQRVRLILAATPEVDASQTHPGALRGSVVVDNLTFRYRDDGPMILDHVSIKAEPGECIALTGPSGSGKSTLLNLVLRFETPHSGAIYLDGRDLASLDITAVRRQIGVVTQDGRIMSGSMFENICTGGVNTMDDAWEAARSAGLAEDIHAMPMGMHTVLSEGGANLSGGQRQRVLIARALVLKPAILIFDEATSALDNRTQAIVTESLNRLKTTRILVAHRLSTIRSADRIYVIEKGRVVQQGAFDDLATQPGLFARLISRQVT